MIFSRFKDLKTQNIVRKRAFHVEITQYETYHDIDLNTLSFESSHEKLTYLVHDVGK